MMLLMNEAANIWEYKISNNANNAIRLFLSKWRDFRLIRRIGQNTLCMNITAENIVADK